MEAVVGKLIGRDVVTHRPGLSCFGNEIAEKLLQLMLHMTDLRALMQQRAKLAVAAAACALADSGVRLEHLPQPVLRAAALIAQGSQRLEVASNMLLVPGGQEGLDVRIVLVQSGPTDAGALGDLGHRHGEQTLLLNELAHRVENGLPHLLPVRLHRVGPQLRHFSTVHVRDRLSYTKQYVSKRSGSGPGPRDAAMGEDVHDWSGRPDRADCRGHGGYGRTSRTPPVRAAQCRTRCIVAGRCSRPSRQPVKSLGPQLRRVVLAAHIVVSVGWIGAAAGYLALGLAATFSRDPETVRAAWIGMALTGWAVIVPLGVSALLTGLWLSLGTPWGLFRHYWVILALILTVLSFAVLLLHMPTVTAGAQVARTGTDTTLVQLGGDVAHPALGLLVLLVVAVLNVHKPRGLTRYGARKQAEERRRDRQRSSTR